MRILCHFLFHKWIYESMGRRCCDRCGEVREWDAINGWRRSFASYSHKLEWQKRFDVKEKQ